MFLISFCTFSLSKKYIFYKSGEIIPKVKRVIESKRKPGAVPFKIPDKCPVCQHDREYFIRLELAPYSCKKC